MPKNLTNGKGSNQYGAKEPRDPDLAYVFAPGERVARRRSSNSGCASGVAQYVASIGDEALAEQMFDRPAVAPM